MENRPAGTGRPHGSGERLDTCALSHRCGSTCRVGLGRGCVGLAFQLVFALYFTLTMCGFQVGQGKVGAGSRLAGGSETGAQAGACGSDTVTSNIPPQLDILHQECSGNLLWTPGVKDQALCPFLRSMSSFGSLVISVTSSFC